MNLNVFNAVVLGALLFLQKSALTQKQSASGLRYDFVISNVLLFDGSSFKPNQFVGIKDGRIEAVFSSTTPVVVTQLTVDGRGKTLLPGLINAHVHTLNQKEKLAEAAQAGVLTVLDLFTPFPDLLRPLRDSARYASFFGAGICATAAGGHGTQFGAAIPTVDRPENAGDFIKARVYDKVDFVKIILERGGNGQLPTLSDLSLYNLVSEAQKQNLKTVVHVSRFEDALKAFNAGANGLAHFWYRDSVAVSDSSLALMKRRPFFVIATLLVKAKMMESWQKQGRPVNWLNMEASAREIYRLHKAGISVLAGTDPPNVNINFGTDLYKELWWLRRGGFSVAETLATATSAPAKAFGLMDRGRIEKGLRADLLLLEGDVRTTNFENWNVAGVWKGGVRIR